MTYKAQNVIIKTVKRGKDLTKKEVDEMEEIREMTEKELKDQTIREYVNIQRIKNAPDKEKELAYQEKVLRARLQSLGVPTEDLNI